MSLHIEPKTVVLLETLATGGARIVGAGNHGSTQDDMVAVLRAQGMEIFGRRDVTHDEHLRNVDDVVRARPDILLDNGADLNAAAVRLGLRPAFAAPRKRRPPEAIACGTTTGAKSPSPSS